MKCGMWNQNNSKNNNGHQNDETKLYKYEWNQHNIKNKDNIKIIIKLNYKEK